MSEMALLEARSPLLAVPVDDLWLLYYEAQRAAAPNNTNFSDSTHLPIRLAELRLIAGSQAERALCTRTTRTITDTWPGPSQVRQVPGGLFLETMATLIDTSDDKEDNDEGDRDPHRAEILKG
jgi:hypothetical protein